MENVELLTRILEGTANRSLLQSMEDSVDAIQERYEALKKELMIGEYKYYIGKIASAHVNAKYCVEDILDSFYINNNYGIDDYAIEDMVSNYLDVMYEYFIDNIKNWIAPFNDDIGKDWEDWESEVWNGFKSTLQERIKYCFDGVVREYITDRLKELKDRGVNYIDYVVYTSHIAVYYDEEDEYDTRGFIFYKGNEDFDKAIDTFRRLHGAIDYIIRYDVNELLEGVMSVDTVKRLWKLVLGDVDSCTFEMYDGTFVRIANTDELISVSKSRINIQ